MGIRISCSAALLSTCLCLAGCTPHGIVHVDKAKQQFDFNSYMAQATQGDVFAEERVGFDYLYGTGVAVDDAQAETWLGKAAVGGSVSAQNILAPHCFLGVVADCKYLKPIDSALQAANAGDKQAQVEVAVRYENGLGVPQDHERAEDMMDTLEHEDVHAATAYGEAISDMLEPVDIAGKYFRLMMQGKLGLLVIEFQYSAGHAINATVVHTSNVKEIDANAIEAIQHLFLPPPPRDISNVNPIRLAIDLANHNLPN